MRINVKALLPRSGNNIIEGTRLAITNFLIYLIIGCLSYGLFKISNWIRHIGIPVPLPVWLILLGPEFLVLFIGSNMARHLAPLSMIDALPGDCPLELWETCQDGICLYTY